MVDSTLSSDQDQQQLDQATETTRQEIHQDPTAAQQLASTPTMQDIVINVEKDLLEEILKNLKEDTITAEHAKELAKEFLALLPIQDKHDLLEKLKALSTQNRDVQGLYLKYAKPYEEEERQRKLHLMSQHIKSGQIEQALAVAKGESTNG